MTDQSNEPISHPAEILIVDDNEANRDLLGFFALTLGHTPILAEDGLSALAKMRRKQPDLVLLDILMPEMDGYQVLAEAKADSSLHHIPILMITAIDDMDSVVQCIEGGADDYLLKPFNPTLLKARISACLERKRLRDQEEAYRRRIEDHNLNLEIRVREQVRELSAAQLSTIFALAKLSESRDPETGEHLLRMREYCRILSEELRLFPKYRLAIDDAFVENIYAAAPLHDIGKVGIPDQILQKPGKLTDEEFEIMKKHTTVGADTLREVHREHPENTFVRVGIEIAASHHEKWNGAGYPSGLVAENIPLVGRILALGDVYDALTSKRCYKEAFTHEKSRDIIVKDRGTHFDPDVVGAFLKAEEKIVETRELYAEGGRS